MAPLTHKIECRPAVAADASHAARAIVLAWRTAYSELVPEPFLSSLDEATIEQQWCTPLPCHQFRQVATLEGVVVGVCSGGKTRDRGASHSISELYSINIHPTHWGYGIGSALLRNAESQMVAMGALGAILWTISDNDRAKSFYLSSGWSPSEIHRTTSNLTGSPLGETLFRRNLKGNHQCTPPNI